MSKKPTQEDLQRIARLRQGILEACKENDLHPRDAVAGMLSALQVVYTMFAKDKETMLKMAKAHVDAFLQDLDEEFEQVQRVYGSVEDTATVQEDVAEMLRKIGIKTVTPGTGSMH